MAGNQPQEKGMDEQAVQQGASIALQSEGVPPPIADAVGGMAADEYSKAKDNVSGESVLKGVETGMSMASDMFSMAYAGKGESSSASMSGEKAASTVESVGTMFSDTEEKADNKASAKQDMDMGMEQEAKLPSGPSGPGM